MTKVIPIYLRHGYAKNSKLAKKIAKKFNFCLGITTNSMIFVDIDEKNIKKALITAIILSFLCRYRVHILFSGKGFHLAVIRRYNKAIWKIIYIILFIFGLDDRLHSWLALKKGRTTLRIFGKSISPKYLVTVDKFKFYKIL